MNPIISILRRGREQAGLTQSQLAEKMGCARDTIARLETERQTVSLEHLFGYIRYCQINPQEVFQALEPVKPGEFAYMLRMHDTHYITPEIKSRFEDWYNRCEASPKDELLINIRKVPVYEQDSDQDPRTQGEQAADKAREVWGLGTAPIKDPVELVESLGIFIQGADLGANDLFALSGKKAGADQYGMVINTNKSITIERQRFSIIHELAHIIAHRDEFCTDCTETGKGRSKDPKEIYADAFAGAFLAPAAEVKQVVHYTTKTFANNFDAIILVAKRYFGISYQTVLLRLHSIGYFGDDQKFGWNFGKLRKRYGKTEPHPITEPLVFHCTHPCGAEGLSFQ